jgi:carboxyl-terminal processing protease
MLKISSLLSRKSVLLVLTVFLSVAVPRSVGAETGAEPNLIEKACELIYQGKFDAAGELIKQSGGSVGTQDLSPALSGLAQIISDYNSISQRRKLAREAAYKEQLAEIEKFRAADANNAGAPGSVSAGPPSGKDLSVSARPSFDADLSGLDELSPDGNDVNNVIIAALSAITRACEFADQAQRERLLSDAFVKRVLQKAIDKAAKFETKGKWLEAYTNCYYWLQAIEPNNKTYSDYADKLLDKAGIAASFQDSPCETREQRYAGVQKEMFVRAIDVLSLNYVSIMDYGQMAKKAIERCKLLAEVTAVSSLQNSSGDPNKVAGVLGDSKKLTAWSVALAAILDEVNQSPTGFDKDKFIGVFEKVLTLNTATVNLPEGVLVAQFSEAALSALDPYTVIVWPRQVEDFEKMMTNEFTGIGVEITKEKGKLAVASLLPDTPAYKAGLDAGDVIEAVDGVETKDMTLVCAVHKITGPKGTKVTLTIRREGVEKTSDIAIIRDKITVPTIRGWQRTEEGKWLYVIDEQNKIGYVRVSSFSSQTSSDLEEVLNQLEAGGGLKGLILDFRFNSGGLLDSAVDVTDKFLEKGLIVKTQPSGRFGSGAPGLPTYAVAKEKGTHPDYPLVILVNSGSASASEIVAGALADAVHKRAILVGERTHGKGSVQGITRYLGEGAQLKYTMAYYYLPSGQRVESPQQGGVMKKSRLGGIGPNIEVELTSDELRKMIEVQRDNDVLVQPLRTDKSGQQHGEPKKPHRTRVEETLAADPQLAIGVLAVKTKLIQADAMAQGHRT